ADQSVTIGAPAIVVVTRLVGCDHRGQVFHRSRAGQKVPVRKPGGVGKGGWRNENFSPVRGVLAVEFGKAQIVANRQPNAAEWRIDCDWSVFAGHESG